MKKKNNEDTINVKELIEAAECAVIGYEKYLLNKIDYKKLADIMKILRDALPEGFDEKYKD
tara:strand:+ start:211 stop:393 length:183 start_codon:yes stop_codon:yes gene_type:complete